MSTKLKEKHMPHLDVKNLDEPQLEPTPGIDCEKHKINQKTK